jgi:hypothetical protein
MAETGSGACVPLSKPHKPHCVKSRRVADVFDFRTGGRDGFRAKKKHEPYWSVEPDVPRAWCTEGTTIDFASADCAPN